MKKVFNRTTKTFAAFVIFGVFFTSCVESRYNHRNHHHTGGWYDRRHQPRPTGVNFEIDVRR